MTKQVLLRTLLVMSALLVLNGCKSDNAKSAKDDAALVLEQGQEPREQLRYQIAHGTTTRATMDYGIATLASDGQNVSLAVSPGVRLSMVSGPTFEGKNGSTRFDVRIVKAEAILPEGTDPAVVLDLNKSVSVLNNVGGWVEVDDRGIIQRSDFNEAAKRADVPARFLVMLINARTSLSRVILPAEAVGLGARWEARKELLLYGFQVNQVDSYTLTEKVGNELKLAVQIQQTAPAQTVTFEEEGVELNVESFRMNATGEIVVSLNALESNATAAGDSSGVLNIKTVDGSEKVEIDRAFEIEMNVIYDLAKEEAEVEAAIKTEEAAGEELEAQTPAETPEAPAAQE